MNIIEEDLHSIIEQVGQPICDLEGSEVLITGGSGFLGSWYTAIIQTLNKDYFRTPCKIYSIDSGIATDERNHIVEINDPNILFRQDDISTIKIEGSVDYIIHAAGIASPIFYKKYPIETIDGMVLGLSNLMKFAVKNPVKSFFTFSSSEIYGNPYPEFVPTKETYYGNVSPIGPRSCYDESKRMEEAMCAAYQRIHNVPVKWVRPFNISGPGMRRVDDRVLPKFIYGGLENRPATVHLPGLQTRTLTYITDGMVGFLKAMLVGKDGEVYNIGREEEEISILDLAERVSKVAFDGKMKIEKIEMPTEYPQDQAQRRCPDVSKAREQLGYDPQVDLDTTILRTKEWAQTKI